MDRSKLPNKAKIALNQYRDEKRKADFAAAEEKAEKYRAKLLAEVEQHKAKAKLYTDKVDAKTKPTKPGPSWDPKRSQKYEKNMTNKFLPFVVESSTPSSIFKTLISRSKGMNQVVLASVFNLVLSRPIGDLREYVKTLPEASLEKIYEELLVKYPDFRIPDSDVNTFLSVLPWFPKTDDYEYWSNELEQYEHKDIITFFLGMIHAGKDISEFTNIPFDKILSTNSGFIYEALNNFKGLIRFDDSGEQMIVVGSRKELVGFVLYKIFLEETVVPDRNTELTYKLVWSQEDASS